LRRVDTEYLSRQRESRRSQSLIACKNEFSSRASELCYISIRPLRTLSLCEIERLMDSRFSIGFFIKSPDSLRGYIDGAHDLLPTDQAHGFLNTHKNQPVPR
jgi:hypothetical protein